MARKSCKVVDCPSPKAVRAREEDFRAASALGKVRRPRYPSWASPTRHNSSWTVIVISLLAVCLIALSSSSLPNETSPSMTGRTALDPPSATTPGATSVTLEEAESTLARGEGPAGGLPMDCTLSGAGGTCSTSSIPSSRSPTDRSASSPAPSFPHPATPAGRYGAAMALFVNASNANSFDVVLFGGANSSGIVFDDTWQFSPVDGNWWNVTGLIGCPDSCPPARHDAMFTYDYEDNYTVLFGGCSEAASGAIEAVPPCGRNATDLLSDTWKFSDPGPGTAGRWTKLNGSPSPTARFSAGFTDDRHDKYLLLFGGCGTTCPLDDTWKFVAGNWSLLSPTVHPPARYGAAMAWVALPNGPPYTAVYLFGGCESANAGCRWGNGSSAAVNDSWEYLAGVWSPLSPACNGYHSQCPSPRYLMAGTSYQPPGLPVMLQIYGGVGPGGVVLGNLTDEPGGGWWELYDSISGIEWVQGSTILGYSPGFPFYYPAAWWAPAPLGPPAPRYDPMLVGDYGVDGDMLFGGSSSSGSSLGDTWWATNIPSPTAELIAPVPVPSPQYGGAMQFDGRLGTVVLAGGCGTRCANSSAWNYSAGARQPWSVESSAPPGRFNASIVYFNNTYQSHIPVIILFGGRASNGTFLNDTWQFTAGGWSRAPMVNNVAPSPRESAAFAFNSSSTNGSAVLFGGCGSTCPLSDTWDLSLMSGMHGPQFQWMQLSPTHSPTARYGASMTYDAADGSIVLFGGCGSTCPLGDTWSFTDPTAPNCVPCAKCTGSNAPPPRWGASMTYDSSDGYVVLFGGCGLTCPYGDTWKYLGGNWTQLTPPTAPPPRYDAAIAYDGNGSYVFLVGGIGSGGTVYGGIGWAFQGGDWYSGQVANAIPRTQAPPAEYGASLATDPASSGGYVLLFGGCQSTGGPSCAAGTHFASTWEYANGQWRVIPGPQPPARWDASLTFDGATNSFLLVGGCSVDSVTCSSGSTLDDVWTFSGAWSRIGTFPGPSRGDAGMAYDSASNQVVLFGGIGCGSICGDSWTYFGGKWTSLGGALPPAVAGAAMAYDPNPALQYVVMVGGVTSSGAASPDVYEFDGATSRWTLLSGSPGFTARYDASLAYDALDGYLMLFGGAASGGVPLSDAWEYNPGGWSQIAASTPIGPRWGMAMAFDPLGGPNGYTLMYGGNPSYDFGGTAVGGGSPAQGDTWTYLGAGAPPSAPAWYEVSLVS